MGEEEISKTVTWLILLYFGLVITTSCTLNIHVQQVPVYVYNYDTSLDTCGLKITEPLPKAGDPFRREVEAVSMQYAFDNPYLKTVFDCQDMSQIVYRLLKDAGYEVKYMVGVMNGENHLWVMVHRDGKWTAVETTYCPIIVCGYTTNDSIYYTGSMYNDSNEVNRFNDLRKVSYGTDPFEELPIHLSRFAK